MKPKFEYVHDKFDTPLHRSDRSDCTVTALAAVYGIPYQQAHDITKKAGRRLNEGFSMYILTNYVNNNPVISNILGKLEQIEVTPKWMRRCIVYRYNDEYREVPVYPTLASIMKKRAFRRGRYILCTNDHAFTLIDGTIVDYRVRMRCRITAIYKLVK